MTAIWDKLWAHLTEQGPHIALALVRIAFIVVTAWALRLAATRLTRRAIQRMDRTIGSSSDTSKRAHTVLPMLISIERFVITFLAVVLCLSQLGIDTSAILAGAGVLGLAVGFGAQNLVKDVISGFFILIDGNMNAGDAVTLAGTSGSVEGIGLRNTFIREGNGKLWAIPNGDIRTICNWSVDWARAVIDVWLTYETDVSRVMALLQDVAAAWALEAGEAVLDPPAVGGIGDMSAAGYKLVVAVKVTPSARAGAEAELRRRIKIALDKAGIEPPYPRQVTPGARPPGAQA